MRIGLLTGGGDCPGLNAAIRAIVRNASNSGDEIVGFRHGWRGVVEGDGGLLTNERTRGILQTGGTILGTARYHPDEHEGGVRGVLETVEREGLDGIIVIGGDGTLTSALSIAEAGVQIVGVPKTIDNDVTGTDSCIGFATAVETAAEAIDRVHTTGESHDRLMVVEVMGRTAGWLALCSGVAAGADAICIPEEPTRLEKLASRLRKRHDSGSNSSVVVVAEGALFENGLIADQGSVGARVAASLEALTGFETRLTVLGHVQRGGSPTASDRFLATRLGIEAFDIAHAGGPSALVASISEQTTSLPLVTVAAGPRPVPKSYIDMARRLTTL
jgi:6-phosphofructokinase 1